tara:strand:+ start:262 stop:450 length:189 start_codon:yes stop_codon:yes gene_type:complete
VFERNGLFSAYAVARKQGIDQQLNNEFYRLTEGLYQHSFVLGWAQLQKNENRKAKRIISVIL